MNDEICNNVENLFKKCFAEINFTPRKNVANELQKLFANKSVKPILVAFSSLNRENFLSAGEILAYEQLTEREIAHLENVIKHKNKASKERQKKKYQLLSIQKEHLKAQNEYLDERKKTLASLEDSLMKERDQYEKAWKLSGKRFDHYHSQKIPEAQSKLASSYQNVNEVMEKFKNKFKNDLNSNLLPSLTSTDLKALFEEEAVLKNYVQIFLEKNFERKTDSSGFKLENPYSLQREKIHREAILLNKSLKQFNKEHMETTCEKNKGVLISQLLEDKHLLQCTFDMSSLEFKEKQYTLSKELSCLQERETSLKKEVNEAYSLLLAEKIRQVCLSFTKEMISWYQKQSKNIEVPLRVAVSQRARYEFLFIFLTCLKQDFQTVGSTRRKISLHLDDETSKRQGRMDHYNELLGLNQEDSQEILINIYKLLRDKVDLSLDNPEEINAGEEQEEQPLPSTIEMYDVIQNKIKALLQRKRQLTAQKENKTYVIQSKEKMVSKLQSYISNGAFNHVESTVSATLGKIALKLASIEDGVHKNRNDTREWEKVLISKRPYRVGRDLFMIHELNKERFTQYMKVIEAEYMNQVNTD